MPRKEPAPLRGIELERWRGRIEEKLSNVADVSCQLLENKEETTKTLNDLSLQIKELSTKISIYVPVIAFGVSSLISILIGVIVAYIAARIR